LRTKTLEVEKFLGKIVKGRGSRINIERGTGDGALPSLRAQRRAQAGTRWEVGTLPGTRTESRACPRTGARGRGRGMGGVTRAGTMRRGRHVETFDMQDSFRERAITKSVGRGRQKRFSIKETANVDQGDGEIFGQSLAVVQMDSTVTTIELRKTGVASAAKGFAHGIR
jgi:hypothetical protein